MRTFLGLWSEDNSKAERHSTKDGLDQVYDYPDTSTQDFIAHKTLPHAVQAPGMPAPQLMEPA